MSRKNFLTVKTKIMLEEFDKEVEYLSALLNYASNCLIEANWKEEDLIKFDKGYSKNFFEEKAEYLPIYTPSRAKYMIFELASNTLKSQYQAHNIFNTLKENCRDLNCDFKDFEGVSWSYVASLLRRIEKWNKYYWIGSIGEQNLYRTSLDTDSFFDFQNMPELNKVMLPYSQTAKYMIKIDFEKGKGEIKLPCLYAKVLPQNTKRDWNWQEFEFHNHDRLKEIVNNYRTINPTIIKKKTKSGKAYYEANIPYQVEIPKVQKNIKRVLSVDLGIKKFATLSILDNFENSRPIFLKNGVMGYLKDLKQKASDLQRRLKRIPKRKFKHLHSYFIQANNKFRNLNKQIAHEVSKFIVTYALANQCDTIALERLTGLKRTKGAYGSRNLNWLISVWIRGKILDYLKYKAKLKGIKVKQVNPSYTSRYCSRCGNLGKTYTSSHLKKEKKSGGHFHCSTCGYNADRDYNASLNIGRLALSKAKYIKKAKVVTYMDSTSLGNGSLKAGLNMGKGAIATMNIVLKSMTLKSYLIAVSPIQHVIKCTNLT